MNVDTRFRSNAPEMMDDFEMEGSILSDALDKIASINRLLGGNKVTIDGIEKLIKNKPKHEIIRIIDIGCGNGAMLRTLAEYADKNNLNFILQGIDANPFTIKHAKNLSQSFANISYTCEDIFDNLTQMGSCDIFLCTLTLHHFKDEEIINLLKQLKQISRLGIVINDLERSGIAYRLFITISFIFRLNKMSREDGLVSILRGFKKEDLRGYDKKIDSRMSSIKWKWAFRYQWIIKTS